MNPHCKRQKKVNLKAHSRIKSYNNGKTPEDNNWHDSNKISEVIDNLSLTPFLGFLMPLIVLVLNSRLMGQFFYIVNKNDEFQLNTCL